MLSWWNRVRGRIVAAQAAAADPDRKPTRFERLMNLLPPFWLAARVEMGPGWNSVSARTPWETNSNGAARIAPEVSIRIPGRPTLSQIRAPA